MTINNVKNINGRVVKMICSRIKKLLTKVSVDYAVPNIFWHPCAVQEYILIVKMLHFLHQILQQLVKKTSDLSEFLQAMSD